MPISPNSTRPLAPHIQIYRWTLTMALSILHRATGLALYAGALALALWLFMLAFAPAYYELVQSWLRAPLGRVFLFLYGWVLLHHLFGGLRHFIWDFGLGFEARQVEWLARTGALVPLLLMACLTFALWRLA